MDITKLRDKAREYLPPEKITVIDDAYRFAEEAHRGQVRASGGPFLEHPLETAYILAVLQMDTSSVAAALLHDIPEDCGVPIATIESKFGPEIARLVDGTTKLSRVSLTASGAPASERQAENLRKMLVAMAQDLRVVFIKLADRLHNMRTLDALPSERQLKIARETLEIYAPLAHRLGMWELKWQLEDHAFRYIDPEKYRRISRLLATRRTQREEFIARVIEILKTEFDRVGLKAEISGRPKHIYSIYQKMERYAAQGKHFDDIHDLLALRVLVDSIPECYSAVGIIHSLWHPLPEAFDDYIANPKPNGYQSLHTTVMCLGTTPLEIQIRTREMHRVSEYGVAAHWRYKEGVKADIHFEEKIAWLRQLVEWQREMSGAEEFLESVKTDIFIDQVFVYTPKGEIKDLPKGATPLDFAYRVHTELGHRCIGAKVNGKLVSLNYHLKNGDIVDIVSSKNAKGPSRDWLNPQLGFVNTSHARAKIKQWFTKQEHTVNVEGGRQILEKELKRLGVNIERQALAALFGYDNVEDFLAGIGDGTVTTHQIAIKLAAAQEKPKDIVEHAPTKQTGSVVRVFGVGNMATHLALCCNPVPGDAVIGYITRNRGVTVHRKDCYNIVHEDERERLVPVEWGEADTVYPVSVRAEAWDRVGLVRDITAVVADMKVNITAVSLTNHDDHTISTFLTLETKGLAQLSLLLKRIESINGVISVTRIGEEAAKKATPKSA
ncbi:MAG: bifunctional (p)ppGpp synthetase/guanosine-3',5'-bis(diphosphate) 3'-pyrophosphohydrolase [Dehalococcoidales bacterium]|nr:bifunctional (p)ppGpp synthetase/guanosine-3',5'-bis(diphosphate) 3'-pyrophosphohydrolase [Dehalococcoidales bacterium]